MSKVFIRISALFDTVISSIAVFTIGSYTLLIFLGVLTRFVFKTPILVGVELARVGFVWSSILGAAVAYKRGYHIAFSVITSILPKKASQTLSLLVDLTTLGFFIWVLYKSIFFTMKVSASVLAATGWSAAVLYFPLPFAMAGMIFHCISFIIQDIDALLNKGVAEKGALS